jgi:Xaa-Pro aminopeptidase
LVEEADLIRTKQQQAIKALADRDIDAWLIFVREGSEPILTSLISGVEYIVQNAAFIFTASGERIALLEPIDIQNGAGTFFDNVIEFQYDIKTPLREIWQQLDPGRVALDYSRFEFAADGLTYGMYLRLMDALGDLGLAEKMVSAEDIVIALRAVKTEVEKARLKKAAEMTVQLAKDMTDIIRPGVTDSDLVNFVEEHGPDLGAAAAHASIAANPVGKNKKGPLNKPIEPGETIVSDMGAVYKGYAADIKRLWYVTDGKGGIPDELLKQWEACTSSLDVALKALRPGRPGYEVHEEAWEALETHGFKRDKHSYGHQVGRRAHDAGPWLGERANRYRPAEGILEAGMIVTLDPTINRVGISHPDHYCMGIEAMAEVTQDGGVLLHEAQEDIWAVEF